MNLKSFSWGAIATVFLLLPILGSWVKNTPVYSDDEPLVLDLEHRSLKIAQFTDLHLTYGFDEYDRKTLDLIQRVSLAENPDLIVISGDLTMSPLSPWLYELLSRFMNDLNIPWTFVLGNHDDDFFDHATNLSFIENSPKLLFKTGPEMLRGGIGNFTIDIRNEGQNFYRLYFMDSKAEYNGVFSYDWLSEAQVAWYADKAQVDQADGLNSSVFMHIPLIEYREYTNYPLVDGAMGEDAVYAQGMNTGFFETMKTYGVSQAVFVGHDHLSNFSFLKDGILLAYGQTSGYNGYGLNPRGSRLITIDENGTLTSTLVLHQDYLDAE